MTKTMRALLCAGMAGAAMLGATIVSAQRPAPILAWSPKPVPATPWNAPQRPIWRLSEILAKHRGQPAWSELIVDDKDFTAKYIAMAPGAPTRPQMWADSRAFWVVQDGQIRFRIQGQPEFVASKGFLVQVPERVSYSMETVGDRPSLRFEVVQHGATPVYPIDVTPPKVPGKNYVKVSFTGQGSYDETNKPFLDFQDVVGGRARGGAFVKDDKTFANIIRGQGTPPPPPTNLGHFHVDYNEFWLVMEGKIDYLLEGRPLLTGDVGDVVYAPQGRWHRASWGGTGMSTRLAINPRPNGMHNYQAPEDAH